MTPKSGIPKAELYCNLNSFLATAIKTLRKQRGLSQNALADLASMDRTHISLIERGQRSLTISSLEKLIPCLDEHTISFTNSFRKQIEVQCLEVQSRNCCAVINGELKHCHLVGKPLSRLSPEE